MGKAKVVLFKPSGKYYTEEEWEIPTPLDCVAAGGGKGDMFAPQTCMVHSSDFRRINDGPVLIPEQEPWGYPGLIP